MTLSENDSSQRPSTEVTTFSAQFGDSGILECDHASTRVNNESVQLTLSEQTYLFLLAQGEGKIRTPRMLLDGLYPNGHMPELKILEVYACKIRSKLREVHRDAGTVVKTVWGRGYAFGTPSAVPIQAPADLPRPGVRWVIARKMLVIEAVQQKRLSVEEILGFYPDLSAGEFVEWQKCHERYGSRGLLTTKVQNYTLLDVA